MHGASAGWSQSRAILQGADRAWFDERRSRRVDRQIKMADLEQHEGLEVTHEQIEQEWAHAYMSSTQPSPLGGLGRPRPKKKSGPGGMIIMVVLATIVAAGSYFVYTTQSQVKAKKAMNDLGQGVITASGIRGHLVTKWDNKQARYMLKIEPIDPRQAVEFAAVTGTPQTPMSITVRVLDTTGFDLCGKEILLPFDPAKAAAANAKPGSRKPAPVGGAALAGSAAQEQAREKGQDMFRNIYNQDGKVEALWAEGLLPCSPDQYDRSYYWDMTTTMPTIAEQDLMTGKTKPESKQVSDDERKAAAHKKLFKPVTSAFYVEGDDYASAYEPARGILWTGPGHHFTLLRKTDQPTVSAWADDGALVHFKCDQHAGCLINRAGSTTLIPARLNE